MSMICDGFRRAHPLGIVLAAALLATGCGGSDRSVEAVEPADQSRPPTTMAADPPPAAVHEDDVPPALADGTALSPTEQAAVASYRRFLALQVGDGTAAEKDELARSSARSLLDQPTPFDGPTITTPAVTIGIHAISSGGDDAALIIDDCATYDYGIEITGDTYKGEPTDTIKDWVRQEVTLEPVADHWVVTGVAVITSSQSDGHFCAPLATQVQILAAWDAFIEGFFLSTEDPDAPLPAGVTAASQGLQRDVRLNTQRLIDTGRFIPAAPSRRRPRISFLVPDLNARVIDCVTWPEGREIWTAGGKSGQVAQPGQVEPISGRIRFGDEGWYVEALDPVSPAECADQPS